MKHFWGFPRRKLVLVVSLLLLIFASNENFAQPVCVVLLVVNVLVGKFYAVKTRKCVLDFVVVHGNYWIYCVCQTVQSVRKAFNCDCVTFYFLSFSVLICSLVFFFAFVIGFLCVCVCVSKRIESPVEREINLTLTFLCYVPTNETN